MPLLPPPPPLKSRAVSSLQTNCYRREIFVTNVTSTLFDLHKGQDKINLQKMVLITKYLPATREAKEPISGFP